jgi:hypothetical protein
MAYIYDLTDTWGNSLTAFNGIKLNVTDTASSAASKLLDLQINGSSKFVVSKSGNVTASGIVQSTSGGFRFPDGTTQTTASVGGAGTVTSVTGAGSVSGLTLTGNVTTSGSLTLGGTLSLTSGNVTSALGFTPYNATNPAGYTTNVGTVTSVSGTGTVSGLSLTGGVTTSGALTLGGTLSLTSGNVTDALGYTPYNATNPAGYITSSALTPYLTSATAATTYQPLDGDLTAIAALAGTVGLIRKTAANTYSLDTSTYLTEITSGQVTTALGYTPYNATNPSGYLSTVSLTANVTGTLPIANGGTGATTAAAALTSLGAYPATNPSGYTSNTGTVTGVTGTAPIASSGGTAPVISIDPATTSLPGSMSAADKTKLDGIATNANNYVLPKATATTLGGVEVFDATVQSVAANAVSSTAARTYGVQLNSADQMVVNVPWTDTASGGTVTSVNLTAGTGVSVSGGPITSSGSITVTNTAPDQVVSITAGSNVVVTGSYPSFTVAVPGGGGGGGGNVSSVDASGGTTGLTFSGGPITSSGVLTLAGTLDLDNGGTGATDAATALTNLGAYPATNPSGYTTNTGTVTSVDLTAGTGISVSGGPVTSSGAITVTNSAPDQVVSLTGAGTTVVTGTYPNFTVTSNDSATGTVTSVGGTGTVSGLSLSGSVTTSGNLTLGGTLSLTSGNVTTALGYTPYDATNPSAYITSSALTPYLTTATAATTYQPLDGDLTAIAALAGTSGIVRKTATDTYTLDTATYLTGITSGQVTTALGFTPYNATNPAGYTTNTGTVTSVGGTGTVNGITLTGTVTDSGSLTLGGTLSGVDLTTQVTGTLPAANGGTGLTSPGTSGNVLTSNGSAWVSQIPAAGGIKYTSVKTANYTAAANDGVQTNTSGGVFTVTLPATPAVGDQVIVTDSSGSWATNNLTVGRNGSTIEGAAEDLICNISSVSVQFVYSGTTWDVFAQVGSAGAGIISVAGGGTGASTSAGALTNLGAAPLASPTFTGTVTTATADLLGSVRSNIVTVAASEVDCSAGNYFIKTASGALTWTVTNVPESRAYSFLLELTNGGTGTQTWFSGIKWPGGTAPTLTASGVDLLGFITDDGGTTWRGVQLMKDSK